MTTQPEALRLADALLEPVVLDKHAMQAADELRRLYDVLGKSQALNRIREARIKELEAAIAAEREACAKVCMAVSSDITLLGTAAECVNAIRARGQE